MPVADVRRAPRVCGSLPRPSSLRQRAESRGANHQLGGAPRIGPLRECSVKLGTPAEGAYAGHPAARDAPRQWRDPGDGSGMAHGVRNERKFATARRRPVLPGRRSGRPAAPRRRPRADLPTPPQTVRGRAAASTASSPRRADSGCRCRDRAVARRAAHGRPNSRRLGPRLEGPRRAPRAQRAASRGRHHDRCARPPWPRTADRSPRRRLCVLTASLHGAAGRPPCEWGPPSIYGAARTQSDVIASWHGKQHPISEHSPIATIERTGHDRPALEPHRGRHGQRQPRRVRRRRGRAAAARGHPGRVRSRARRLQFVARL